MSGLSSTPGVQAGTAARPSVPRLAPRITVREAQPSDAERLREAFNKTFARIDPNFVPRSPEAWQWRYQRNPAGWRCFLSETDDGRIVGQQCGIPVQVRAEGQDQTWTQVCDTFIDPAASSSLGGSSLFRRTAAPFSEQYGGAAPAADPVLFGLPTRRAHRIGGRQLGYRVIRNQHRLVLEASRYSPASDDGVQVSLLSTDRAQFENAAPELDELFERAAEGVGATLIKRADYLRWRYLDRPDVDYCMLLARCTTTGEALGLAVATRGSFGGEAGGLIAEWIVAPDEARRASAALLDRLQGFARSRGIPRLVAVQSERGRHFTWFQQAGFRVAPSPYYLVGRCYTEEFDVDWLYEHWDYSLGDFDLC